MNLWPQLEGFGPKIWRRANSSARREIDAATLIRCRPSDSVARLSRIPLTAHKTKRTSGAASIKSEWRYIRNAFD